MLQATINPRSITPHPSNPRRDVGDVTDLAASIAAVGRAEAQAELELDRAAATELRRAFLVGLLDAATDEQLKRLLIEHLLFETRQAMAHDLLRDLLSVDEVTEEVLRPRSIRALTLLAMLTGEPLGADSCEHWIRHGGTSRVWVLSDAAALAGYGLTLEELDALSPRMRCARILDVAIGQAGHPDEQAMRQASLEQIKVLLANGPESGTISELEAIRNFIGELTVRLGLIELRD